MRADELRNRTPICGLYLPRTRTRNVNRAALTPHSEPHCPISDHIRICLGQNTSPEDCTHGSTLFALCAQLVGEDVLPTLEDTSTDERARPLLYFELTHAVTDLCCPFVPNERALVSPLHVVTHAA
jgi:hypothetical protein